MKEIKNFLKNGFLGRILWSNSVVCSDLRKWRPGTDYTNNYTNNLVAGGVINDYSHEIDLINFFFGKNKNVRGFIKNSQTLGLKVEDYSSIIMENKTGIFSTINFDYCCGPSIRKGIIRGIKASLFYNLLKRRIKIIKNNGDVLFKKKYGSNFDEEYEDEIESFLKEKERHQLASWQDGIEASKVIDKIYKKVENNLIIIQARMSSTRFPGKVLKKLGGHPTIEWIYEAAKKVNFKKKIIIATSNDSSDDVLVDWCRKKKIKFFRGSLSNVLERFTMVSNKYKSDNVIRLTADCPFIDAKIIDQILYLLIEKDADYASNTLNRTWPDGLDCEVFTRKGLLKCFKNAKSDEDKEHVTRFFYNNKNKFKCINLPFPIGDFSDVRVTFDNKNDYQILNRMAKKLNFSPNFMDTVNVYKRLSGNKVTTKFKNSNTFYNEKKIFFQSNKLFTKVKKKIPLASQTFSKSYIQLPIDNAPLFITHGKGCYIWDVDGNQYIDFMMGLHSIILGYCDKDINESIKEQLDEGINFSLASTLEKELAEILINIIPCAEMVRFGKNGTDANTGAIRLAREIKKKSKIITCGYHGWNDWYISSTSFDNGIPKDLRKFILPINYKGRSVIYHNKTTQR